MVRPPTHRKKYEEEGRKKEKASIPVAEENWRGHLHSPKFLPNMGISRYPVVLLVNVVVAAIVCFVSVSGHATSAGSLKSVTHRSPAFTLKPGEVQNQYYYGVPFPTGRIGIKGFDAEVVDEDGNSVPLSDVYLHHWVVINYYSGNQSDMHNLGFFDASSKHLNSSRVLGNDGVCPHRSLSQLFGLGSETRLTNTHIPGPYAIEVGTYDEEAWLLNVHAIDTRGTVDPYGCLECRCDLYNVTVDEDGQPLRDGYTGGLLCCYDGTQCQLKSGYAGEARTYYLQYTVHYLDWEESILPVKVYILDATYEGSYCKVEYDVPSCDTENSASDCVHTQETVMNIPIGGDVIYGVAHQHAGGVGAALFGEDGREICKSSPLYGNGTEVGNEAGYIVGMTTCYPEPGSVQVSSGESVFLQSNYSRMTSHTGVMGLGYLLVYPSELSTF